VANGWFCRSNVGFEDKPQLLAILNRSQFVLQISIALSIVGGLMRNPTHKPDSQKTGRTLVRVAIILITLTFVVLIGYTAYFWAHRDRLTRSRLTLLRAFSLSIPFLIVRIIYSIISSFSSSLHSMWNPVYGSWVAFLVMALAMEYIVVVIYMTAGMLIPYGKDHQVEE
jgi:hypothetical protein